MKLFFSLFATALLFASCSKNPKETVTDPAAEAAFTRTVVYTNQNNLQITASYNNNQLLQTRANIDGNQLVVGLYVMPLQPGNTGDGIFFRIDKSFLQQGLQNTYAVGGQTTPAVQNTRYTFMVEKPEGGFWSSIHETGMGLQMQGSLTITEYNANRKLMSGTFNVVIKDLISDPLNYNRVSTIDPINLNTVTLSGTFTNVKLATE
jgi:hypothetical protein